MASYTEVMHARAPGTFALNSAIVGLAVLAIIFGGCGTSSPSAEHADAAADASGGGAVDSGNTDVGDAALTAPDGSSSEASTADSGTLRRCSLQGCNGSIDSVASHPSCPPSVPTLGAACAIDAQAVCFYCETDEPFYPLQGDSSYVCANRIWAIEAVSSACD